MAPAWNEISREIARSLYTVGIVLVLLHTSSADDVVQDLKYNITFNIREDASVNTLVGEVKGNGFTPPYSSLIVTPTNDNKTSFNFNFDIQTGRVTTKNVLDREDKDRYAIIFTKQSIYVVVTINVLDINDNTPAFSNPTFNTNISESAPIDHKIALGSVWDEDLGENTTQRVEIVSGNSDNDFELTIKNTSNTNKLIELRVVRKLDYETISSYRLVIRAVDGGGRFSDMTVDINILDQNDNEPIFNISKYSAKVTENVTVGTAIIQVFATDSDSGDNGRVSYSIDHRSDPEEYFTIDPKAGWVKVNKPLDYEKQDRFSLTLQATDHGNPPQQGTAALDIIVENINEQPANVSIEFLAAFPNGRVLENTAVGTKIAGVSVEDFDNSGISKVIVTLYNSQGYFILRDRDLYINKTLDRETTSSFEMSLQVTDLGNPPLRATKDFKVIVDDVNDNAPVFEKPSYVADVDETAEIGMEVLTVSATDADVGVNKRITYTIQDQTFALFTVDSRTGKIYTSAAMDCDLNPHPSFVVVATDGGDPPMMSSAQVTINVQDVNDKEPEFEASFYSIKITENRRIGDCILTVSATDPECGNSQVTYRMGNMLAPLKEFRVNSLTGDICVQGVLDYEVATSYQFQVEAVDSDNLTSQAVIQVEITDINDNNPRFEPRVYSINVMADAPPGPLVTVQARDRDSGVFGTVTYSIISGNNLQYFSINPNTGTISLKPGLTEKVSVLSVRATDGGGLTSQENAAVTISVISGNEHPPIFTPTMYNFTITEAAGLNQMVGRVEANLDGSGGSTAIMYSITFQTVDWFKVDSNTGAISTKSALDRESSPFVVISIQAQAWFPPVYAVAQVNITILDVNDNAPTFPATTMLELEIREDEAANTSLYVARAVDLDMGNNGTVRYRLVDTTTDTFAINVVTGEITLKKMLDYEKINKYLIVVVAEDLGTPKQLSANLTLTVKVKDINDNPPVFDRAVYWFYVPEDVDIGSTINQVRATDEDSGNNKKITFSFRNNRYGSTFGISPVDGKVWTRDLLDRELHDTYEITVQAVDHGSPVQLSSTALVRITVTDVNDNDPVFSRDEYRFSIRENLVPDSLVGQVVATDQDIGPNGDLQFFFYNVQNYFKINSKTGEIRTQVLLDRELVAEHFLTVYVSDNGNNSKSAQTKVKVKVQDQNDNDPVFQRQGPFASNISENRPKGTVVTTLVALDPDEGENGRVAYYFDAAKSEESAMSNFEVHPTSGRVSTREVLDYETKTVYHLTIVAKDNGLPPRSSSQPLTISILDVNDQAPLFQARNVSFNCVENVSIGTFVGQVKATDKDSGENGKINYYLVGGNVFGSFSVNQSTGVITTVRQIDYEESSSHSLNIQAVDNSAAWPKSSNITVTIFIKDVNDNPPVFDQDPVIIRTIAENMPLNTVIHTFLATDRDSGINGTVKYFIDSSSQGDNSGSYLAINPDTGEMYISAVIDYETVQQISVIVVAKDACPSPTLSSQMTTIIFVTDVNDNAPRFEPIPDLSVSEDEAVGFVLTVLVAIDQDSNVDNSGNNLVRYRIVSGNEDGRFYLHPETGSLQLNDALDYETKANYTLNISAEDMGMPKLVNYKQLYITLIDANDNSPVFKQSTYHANITENSPVKTPVISVLATDADTGLNGALTYQIPSGIVGDRFTVDPKTGLITNTVVLDREERDSYTITVYVQDGAYPFYFSTCRVVITVVDINDNPPIFKEQTYKLEIPENRAQNSVISLVATDRDVAENARVTYAITGGDSINFIIDPQYGHLSNQPLDRETIGMYNLTITAQDHGPTPLSATAYVIVTVLDENDNSPSFDQVVYTASIPEDIKPSTVVLNVRATDPDLNENGRVMYSLGNETGGLFDINSTTGVIYTSGMFDREKVDRYSITIMASDSGSSGPRNTTARIQVTVTDVNDNAPTFAMVPYTARLNATTPKNSFVLSVSTTDPDLGVNGMVEYSLDNGDSVSNITKYFRISSVGEVFTSDALVTVPGRYRLNVIAKDLAVPASSRLTSTGVIEITIGSPESTTFRFTSPEYRAQINENSPINTLVVQVATETLPPTSTTAVYSFASGNENGAFKINGTGHISVQNSQRLDYETNPSIRLIVMATSGSLYAYTTVWVNLTDVNDNVPRFSQSRYVSAIWENNPAYTATYVTQVYARDADSGMNGEILYSIIGGNDRKVFHISMPHTGIVHTSEDAESLDREANPEGYRLVIEARDRGVPFLASTCELIITIVDENDSPPHFPEIPPQNVTENQVVGYSIVMATANDVDLNPILVYDFVVDGNPDNTFSLDSSTGRLTLAKPLDHERKSLYNVGIQVSDGDPDHTSKMWITVNVIDVNDNAPVFSHQSYEVALPEQTSPNQSVLTVVATDDDSGQNAEIVYSMGSSQIDSFTINPVTGTIYTNKTIMFKAGESIIQFVVVARDKGNPSQSSMVAVHIQITDVNKFPPTFVTSVNYIAHVSESAQRGVQVLQVSAVDNDLSYRGEINYTLVGLGTRFFYIHQRTGQIFYNGGLDYETKRQHEMRAVATDKGVPPKNASIPVIIYVDDENDNPPVFLENGYTITLSENYSPGRIFLTVNATDADSGPNAEVKFFITSGNNEGIFFNPHNEGGLMIIENMHLDYETQSSHRLIMRAVDCGSCLKTSPRLSAFVTVDILVSDVNEFGPRFPIKHYMEEILENSDNGTVVFQAHASDGDGGEMGIVTYSLRKDLDYESFSIDPLTGDIYATKVFDYEAPKQQYLFNLIIMATDRGQSGDSAEVTIRLVDVDEYQPHLNAKEYSFEVPGSAKAGDFVGQVSATDQDTGDAGRLVFEFVEPNDYFTINSTTGNITVAVALHDTAPVRARKKRALTLDSVDLVVKVSSGIPGSKQDTSRCVLTIDRTCSGCQVMASTGMTDGVRAAIIVVCLIFIIVIIAVIIIILYRRRLPKKSDKDYSSDSTIDLAPPPQLPDRPFVDHIRPVNLMASDVSDQSQNSASSGRGSAEAEDEDEEISRINSNTYLHSSQAFRQTNMPDSGIQHDDDTLSEPVPQTHQEYLANLGIDSSKIGKSKAINKVKVEQLGRSAESMHQFSDEGGGEGGVDTDVEKMTDLETDEESSRHVMSFHEPDTHNVGSLTSVVNSEEVNSGSYNWDYLIDWGPQYQPLAHVFSEIAKLKDDSITPKKQPIKTVPQRQFNSSIKQPQVRTVPPPIITNAPPMAVPLPGHMMPSDNESVSDYAHQSPTLQVGRSRHHHHHHHQVPSNHFHHNHQAAPYNHQAQQHAHHYHHQPTRTSHMMQKSSSPPQFAPQQCLNPHFSPQIKLLSHSNHRSPQQHHSPRMGIHPHIHPPPPQHPPPPIPQQPMSSSSSRGNSTHASTMNISLPSLPRSPISYESSLTSVAMTPSLTPSLSPLATRSPSVSPVATSGHTTPGQNSSRQNLISQSSKSHDLSSSSEREFTI